MGFIPRFTWLLSIGSLHQTTKVYCCCCCCCKVASVVSNSVQPHRWQPTRLPGPWGSPGKNIRVGCHFLLQCMKGKVKVKSLSRVWLLATPWTAAHQAPPSMGFSRQEYWRGVPLPSPTPVYYLTPNHYLFSHQLDKSRISCPWFVQTF